MSEFSFRSNTWNRIEAESGQRGVQPATSWDVTLSDKVQYSGKGVRLSLVDTLKNDDFIKRTGSVELGHDVIANMFAFALQNGLILDKDQAKQLLNAIIDKSGAFD